MRRDASVPSWLLAAALAVPALGLASPLLEVDDARFAQVPAEMAASHDWVLPTLDGTPYVEKPPLWYWAAAASYKVFGVSVPAARGAMWLLALLGLAGTWWLGSWLYSPEIGRAAAAATATAGLWLFLTHNMTLDLPVSAFLLWTTALALRALLRPEDARWAAPAAWAAAGLAFLSKGLIAFVLPALWVAGLAALKPQLRRGARALLSPPGVLVAAAIVVPWLAGMQKRRPDFFHVFFVEQHFLRYLTPLYNRDAPWWFFLMALPVGMLPWTAPMLAGLERASRQPRDADARGSALAAWIVGVPVFFTFSHSKLASYVLPVIPHAALLAAAAIEEGLPAWTEKLQRALGALLLGGAVLAAAALAAGLMPARLWPPHGLPGGDAQAAAAFALAIPAVLGSSLLLAGLSPRPAAVLAAGGALAGVCFFAGLRPSAPLVSARDIAQAIRAEARPGDQVWTYSIYLHGLEFYSGRPVDKMVDFVGEFRYAKRDAAYAGRFGDATALGSLPRAGGRTFIAMRSVDLPQVVRRIKGGQTSLESSREFGPWTLAVVRDARRSREVAKVPGG